jgi:hypothetical protein
MQTRESTGVIFATKREGDTALKTDQGQLTMNVSAIRMTSDVVEVDIRVKLGPLKIIQQLEVPNARSAFVWLQNALSRRQIVRTIETGFHLKSGDCDLISWALAQIAEEMIAAVEATQRVKQGLTPDQEKAWASTVETPPPTINEPGSPIRDAGAPHVMMPTYAT